MINKNMNEDTDIMYERSFINFQMLVVLTYRPDTCQF